MNISMVIDIGFGDSGKGVAVDYLAKQQPEHSLVVRFSGGHQVGHTVTVGDVTHTFSHFGSGTLRGVPTYYTQHTTMFPLGLAVEYKEIKQFKPQNIYHPLVMVTTPYDIAFNRARERQLRHGSCGVGFGATIDRNSDGITLYVMDMQNTWVFSEKLKSIKQYYLQKLATSEWLAIFEEELRKIDDDHFIEICKQVAGTYQIASFSEATEKVEHLIFEGSQGIMLDQVHGIFPHVTRSYTTCKNAMEFLSANGFLDVHGGKIDIYYISRCYQTRHGHGPMSNNAGIELINNDKEANQKNDYQGEFRTAKLDPELLSYAIHCNQVYCENKNRKEFLLVTCLDQRPDFDVSALLKFLASKSIDFSGVLGGYSPDSASVKFLRQVD